jgi:pyruvate/2-oxoglutarate dehydrogenase complex dihydrolipoamide dehydrogenase (E3) component
VRVLCDHKAVHCDTGAVTAENSGGRERIEHQLLIVAVGRSARLTGYGLEALGIEAKRSISTNEYLQTLLPNIYAAGDAAGPYQFTHVAAHQACSRPSRPSRPTTA